MILVLAELTTIYEETSPDTLLFMGDDFQMKFVELQKEADSLKKIVNELEITSQFSKKLLDLNAEVSYIGGAEFVSNQASERVFSIEKYVAKLIEGLRLKEYDLAKAKSNHIGRSTKASTPIDKSSNTEKIDKPTSTTEDENESNFEIMNSRED